jgi:hypothetical protein
LQVTKRQDRRIPAAAPVQRSVRRRSRRLVNLVTVITPERTRKIVSLKWTRFVKMFMSIRRN